MQFFEAIDGKSYSMAAIVSIDSPRSVIFRDSKSGSEREGIVYPVNLSDGSQVEINEFDRKSWQDIPQSSFAAAPGTVILHPDAGEPRGYFTTPVLGWAIMADRGVCPVTTFGVNDGNGEDHHVLLPTGEVVSFERTLDNIEAWLEGQKSADASA
ncbi:hypothetical protein N6H05_09615 [Sphingobium sp. WTD-1]|uniref:hypothetical protein n=1 Tax=Sphingobium sp. WTD-1 TaxID=2979467 RepID=UPI0024DE2165|nr:hypothetical protein [Sphingobium sp. WTD-1]WIA58027.1 hypothetical protein N6H05_09615 [Sphingobium sp. WTD-1]